MKRYSRVFILTMIVLPIWCSGSLSAEPASRQRVLVLTDISNEPDDEQSLVRFLVYSNEFDIEGLIATTSTYLKRRTREDLIRRGIQAYGQVHGNLIRHAKGFPTEESLMSVTTTGQPEYGFAAVGDGKSSAGSKRIIEAVDRADDRPIWICIWGGANTLAQAMHDVKSSRDAEAVDAFVKKMRVYAISDQDDAGYWLRKEFPKLFYIVSPCRVTGSEYWRATWTGISGDRHYRNGPMYHFDMVDNPWLDEHIRKDKGPLGALYPRTSYIMEGDTPSFLGLINNGLSWHSSPDFGGWGGRYQELIPYGETRKIWTETRDSRDTVVTDKNGKTEISHQATIWRWREHFQNDFAARMNWCIADDFKKANHNPVAILNGDQTKNVVEIDAKPGVTVRLSAEGTTDPDADAIQIRWWIYAEAGSFRDAKTGLLPEQVKLSAVDGMETKLLIPAVSKPATIHVIMEVCDSGSPRLWSYRRAILKITAGG